jgi:hypothetical protein
MYRGADHLSMPQFVVAPPYAAVITICYGFLLALVLALVSLGSRVSISASYARQET